MKRVPVCSFVTMLCLYSSPSLAFECTNSGTAGATPPEDSGWVSAIACGGASVAANLHASAFGTGSSAAGQYTVAVGSSSSASDSYSLALGANTISSGFASVALGHRAAATGSNSTAVGYAAVAEQANTVVLGSIPGVAYGLAYANVGMGTHTPSEAVDVQRSDAAARFQLTSYSSIGTQAPQYIQRRARGTDLAPLPLLTNDNLGLFSFRGYNGSAMGGSRATITAQAAGNFTTNSTPTRIIFSTTPVGKTVPEPVLTITPDGKVQVKGTNLNVPDYVFEDDYPLMPLSELRSFIDANGHLPGIPSAEEVGVEGHDLAGSDMAHLRKIEELTLYTLQQQATIDTQQATIDEQRHASERLQRRNAELERRAHDVEARLARIEALLGAGVPGG